MLHDCCTGSLIPKFRTKGQAVMAKELWFKFWSADYLTDSRVDSIPREAEGLLIRMWCVCNTRGFIPADPKEIARLTCCDSQYVSQCVSHCVSFFEERDGNLYSHRMEREKAKSDSARKSAEARYSKNETKDKKGVIGTQCETQCVSSPANRTAQKAESRKQIEPTPIEERRSIENSDSKIALIAKLHPKLAHLQETELPMNVTHTIIAAVESETNLPGRPPMSEVEALRHVYGETRRVVDAYQAVGRTQFIKGPAEFWLLRQYRLGNDQIQEGGKVVIVTQPAAPEEPPSVKLRRLEDEARKRVEAERLEGKFAGSVQ